jgi:hypothetical protein
VTLVDTTNPAIGGISVGAGSGIALPGLTDVPVVVGTSVEVLLFQATPQSTRLQLRWENRPSNPQPTFTFDVPTSPAAVQGLVLPNLGPFLSVAVSTNIASTIFITLLTGLPPLARSPLIASGDLTRYNAAIADGADSGEIVLPPYVGDAQVFLTALVAGASPAAGAIFAILRSKDYTGAPVTEIARVGATTQFIAGAGTTSLQPPYIWKMSPRINSIQVYNRIGGGTAVSVDMAISVSGP